MALTKVAIALRRFVAVGERVPGGPQSQPRSRGVGKEWFHQVHAIEFAKLSAALLIGGEVTDGVFEVGVGGEGVPALEMRWEPRALAKVA